MIIDSGIATGSFLVLGPYTQTGSADINGILTVTDGITGSLFGTAEYAIDAGLLDGYNADEFVLSSSYNTFTSSYYINSASFSSSIAALQVFSSSLDTGYVTEAELNAATASLSSSISILSSSYLASSASFNTRILADSSSIGILSSSYLNSSASFDTRILNVSSSVGILSSSYLASSASFNTQLLANSSSIGILSSSYLNSSASFNTRILDVSSSVGILSSSYLASSASFNTRINNSNTGSFTGSFRGAFTGSFSGSLWNLQNSITNHIPYFSSSQVLADSSIIQIDNGYSVAINQNGVTTAAPEALYVWQPSTSSYNVISGKGNLDNYLQLNIQNINQGVSASSDVVATANNGTENTNYIDMGINNENFDGPVGEGNDAYLYSTGRHLHIGNASNFPVQFFVGGTDTDVNRKLQLNSNNQHELTGSLNISNILIVNNGITGSLFGTASNATTASYARVATSASYADNFTVAGTLTAQTLVVQTISSSVIYSSGSNIFGNNLSNTQKFTGSVQVTGSLTVNNSSAILTNQTSSMTVLSSSYALTASFASNVPVTASYAISASQAQNAISSSYALTASYASVALSASYSNISTSSSYAAVATSASYAVTTTSASYAVSASQTQNSNTAVSSSFALTASFIDGGFY